MRPGPSLRTSGTSVERSLLSAGLAEKPDGKSVERAAVALGLAPRAVVAGGLLALVLRYVRGASRWARAAIGAGGLGAAALVTYAVSMRAVTTSPSVAAPSHAPTRLEPPVAPSMGAGDGIEPTAQAPVEPRPSSPRSVPLTRSTPRTAPLVATLSEQTLQLDRARESLEMGDVTGAQAMLDEFDRRFAGTPLAEESAALRIEALARRGDHDATTRAARQFLRKYPGSVHAVRVTELLRPLSQ